jgi:hypothetical protein
MINDAIRLSTLVCVFALCLVSAAVVHLVATLVGRGRLSGGEFFRFPEL